MTNTPTRIIIVDDHPMIAEGIEAILETYDDIEIAGVLTDGQQAIDRVEELQPDVILLDLNMPGVNGLSATEIILERRPETRILILSMHDSPEYISTALSHGAKGYLLKDVPTEELNLLRLKSKGSVFLSACGARLNSFPTEVGGFKPIGGK